MNVKDILAQIPESLLDELSAKNKTDKYAKKLKGSIVFKLLLHYILPHKDNSLLRMSSSFENIFFSYLNGENKSISYMYEKMMTSKYCLNKKKQTLLFGL
jgi:hypothetical protein